jgi:uncharacterized protein YecA (UPF0149 family)
MDAGMDALMALAEKQISQRFREEGLASIPTPVPVTAAAPTSTPMASNCKPAAAVPATTPWFPRNAPCRCGSGAKFKRCCGNPAAAPARKVA